MGKPETGQNSRLIFWMPFWIFLFQFNLETWYIWKFLKGSGGFYFIWMSSRIDVHVVGAGIKLNNTINKYMHNYLLHSSGKICGYLIGLCGTCPLNSLFPIGLATLCWFCGQLFWYICLFLHSNLICSFFVFFSLVNRELLMCLLNCRARMCKWIWLKYHFHLWPFPLSEWNSDFL